MSPQSIKNFLPFPSNKKFAPVTVPAPEQKVIFKFEGTNLAELEMRNDNPPHYREIRFNMNKPKAMRLLFSKITLTKEYNDKVILYGEAIKHFGHWNK